MTRKKNIPSISYVILFFVGVVCFVISFHFKASSAWIWIRDITINLGAGIIVVILTIILIDNIISSNQEKERKKYQSVALQQLETPLVRQLYLLFYIFKASLEIKPQKQYQNVRDLFDDDFFQHLVFFDFSKKAPIYGPVFGGTQWFDYISHECKEFVDALNRTLGKYSLYLDSEIVEIMEQIINSFFMSFVSKAPVMRDIAKNEGYKQGPCNFFNAPGMGETVREYTDLFTRLVEHHNDLVTEEKKILIRMNDHELWRNDFVPIGSGRVSVK